MPDENLAEVIRTVEIWQLQRTEVFARSPFEDGANPASLREFVEIQNRLARYLISVTGKSHDEFWTAMMELAVQAQTITRGAKTFVNGQDRSSEGM